MAAATAGLAVNNVDVGMQGCQRERFGDASASDQPTKLTGGSTLSKRGSGLQSLGRAESLAKSGALPINKFTTLFLYCPPYQDRAPSGKLGAKLSC